MKIIKAIFSVLLYIVIGLIIGSIGAYVIGLILAILLTLVLSPYNISLFNLPIKFELIASTWVIIFQIIGVLIGFSLSIQHSLRKK
jgi:hypothetical protein